MPKKYHIRLISITRIRIRNSLLASVLLTLSATTALPVEIPDPELEAKIRSALDKPTGEITQADMESLTILNATASPAHYIVDLTGLEAAVNLTILELSFNETPRSKLRGI